MPLHCADLDVARVRTEEVVGIEIEGILHVAGRMVFRKVESFEVIVVCVDIRA